MQAKCPYGPAVNKTASQVNQEREEAPKNIQELYTLLGVETQIQAVYEIWAMKKRLELYETRTRRAA